MNKLIYIALVCSWALFLVYVKNNPLKDEDKKSQEQAEIDNLRYQLNQCKLLYTGKI